MEYGQQLAAGTDNASARLSVTNKFDSFHTAFLPVCKVGGLGPAIYFVNQTIRLHIFASSSVL